MSALREVVIDAISSSRHFQDGDPTAIADDVIKTMVEMPLIDLLRGLASATGEPMYRIHVDNPTG